MAKLSDAEKIAGWHAVSAVIERRPDAVLQLWLQEGREDGRVTELRKQASAAGIRQTSVKRADIDREAAGLRHQGVLAWVLPLAPGNQNDLDILLDGLEEPPFLLVLDCVEDPRNLGACLRTADAAGVHAVITPRDKTANLTAAARKAAAGAAETVPLFQVSNLARCLRDLQDRGIWLVGLAGTAQNDLYASKLTGPLALAMGAEAVGLRRLTSELCDELVRIPMWGSVESLNVSVAAAVCIYEACRQRRP